MIKGIAERLHKTKLIRQTKDTHDTAQEGYKVNDRKVVYFLSGSADLTECMSGLLCKNVRA